MSLNKRTVAGEEDTHVSITVFRPVAQKLEDRADALGLDLKSYVDRLVADDSDDSTIPEEKIDRFLELLESLKLDHGDEHGRMYFAYPLDVCLETEKRIWSRAFRDRISPAQYLLRRLEADV
jgi:hypothetical protein